MHKRNSPCFPIVFPLYIKFRKYVKHVYFTIS